MKKLLFLILVLSSFVRADVVDNRPSIILNTQVINTAKYPNMKFIVCYYGMKANSSSPFGIISCRELNSSTLIKGYIPHLGSTLLYAVPKEFYDSVDIAIILQNHTFTDRNDNYYVKSLGIPVISYTNDQNYNIDEETRLYKITSVSDENVTLKLEKRIIHFTNGEDNKTINY